eukprot:TRINITY_DN13395_c0_g1_i9.p2 TRINITY_DN13395_c0_g1~~TRINITY_DN13395_c0_g1_i9.p2  ORF type:complete len:213 (+),score=21.54 TRINITY_DN13395_c0_g1_i9:27-665(+)
MKKKNDKGKKNKEKGQGEGKQRKKQKKKRTKKSTLYNRKFASKNSQILSQLSYQTMEVRIRQVFLLVTAGLLLSQATGHIQLSYPPPTFDSDFLDNVRTSGLCGHVPNGADNSNLWRMPDLNEDVLTTVLAGEELNMTWNLHYAHQGGWQIELYKDSPFSKDPELLVVWNSSEHWGCGADGTQTSAVVQVPDIECESCFFRFIRQAQESRFK